MKTKKDYEDVWQKARFDQKIIYKNMSGQTVKDDQKDYARELCLTIHHRYQDQKVSEQKLTTDTSTQAEAAAKEKAAALK